jgi:hypothetical protein
VSLFGGLSKLFGGGGSGKTALLAEPSTIDELDSTGLIGNVELADDGAFVGFNEKGIVTARGSGMPSIMLRRLELRSPMFSRSPKLAVKGDGDGDAVNAPKVSAGDGSSCIGF